ncbi:retrotransposon protein [Hordeum vulgare]|nr:retrotransposon protein [Hordeum vulgare]
MAVVRFGAAVHRGRCRFPLLMPTGYTSWEINVKAILDAQGLWGMVAPAAGAAVDAGRCKLARAMLLTALHEDLP